MYAHLLNKMWYHALNTPPHICYYQIIINLWRCTIFRPDNVSEIRWAFYVKLFKFFVASVVVLAFLILLLSNIGGALIGILMLVAYIPPAIGYVLFHTHFAIEAEKNAPPQEIPVETEEK